MTKNGHKVSLDICIIAKNEEDNLSKTLPYGLAGADNVIVVDTGSTDSTKKIAGDLGAKVFDFEWTGDFAAARNHSISRSTADWIMAFDADEHMSVEDLNKLRDFLDITECNLISLPRCECAYGRSEAKNVWYRPCLFRNLKGVRFERAVNEQVVFPSEIPVKECRFDDVRIIHWAFGLPDEKLESKNVLRLKMLEDAVKNNPDDPLYRYLLAQRYIKFVKPPDTTKAKDNFTRLIDMIDSNDRKCMCLRQAAYVERGRILLAEKAYDLAELDANAAMDIDNGFVEPYIILATICLVRKDNEAALKLLEKACLLNEKQHPIMGVNNYFWRVVRFSLYASCLFDAKKYEESLIYYQKVLDAGHDIEKTSRIIAAIRSVLEDKSRKG